MPVVFEQLRDGYKALLDQKGDPRTFAKVVAESTGFIDSRGRGITKGPAGAPSLAEKPKYHPSEFRLDTLAEAMIGPDWKNVIGMNNPNSPFDFTGLQRDAARTGMLQEEVAAPMGPSPWSNVAAWSATVGGLLGAQFTLGYEQAPFELRDIFPVRPAVFWQGGERIIDVVGPWKPAAAVGPGVEYPDNTMSALWVEPGAMVKYGGKISLTKELMAIDISGGQILSQANSLGDSLAYRENELNIDVLLAITQNWRLGMLPDSSATNYNTYNATITDANGNANTIPNQFVNPLTDVGAFQRSDQKLAQLKHPLTGNPIRVNMSLAVFPTPLASWANMINGVTNWSLMNQGTAGPQQPAPGSFPSDMLQVKNPWTGWVRAISSQWLYQRMIASATQTDPNQSPGLGFAADSPQCYQWWRIDPARAACRRQFWAPTSQALNPSDWVMAVQGIAAGFVADMAMMVQVLSGYHIQRNLAQ